MRAIRSAMRRAFGPVACPPYEVGSSSGAVRGHNSSGTIRVAPACSQSDESYAGRDGKALLLAVAQPG